MPDPIVINRPNGNKPQTSQNLRGILDYARKHPIQNIGLFRTRDCGARLVMVFADNAWSIVAFADHTVAYDWILARRSWGKPVITGSKGDNSVTFAY